ncbi:23S rRNA (uracil(1939)-C(5))-methyltransferase [Saliniradius amylolyticus]|uniref:23S rRNA (Uracil(1939)-C(5))-methyltransferase n=1 Tax=Saliniradius amylolyticus TaxID=2183582 RepID=A0A2S2E1W3_9ALTE|nr:23S rRNA (uracil(1939)-C(5))-methyltransferase RlmD [Saliniradius amylolyticus]AWL11017.1 23S rRNA (uracil(1939)-C(5))-methyltransferase [Saliniradius amylolyticus]
MVKVFRPPKSKSRTRTQKRLTTVVDTLDHAGVGVCREHKPVIFAEGGLPGERCRIGITEQKRQFWRGQVQEVIEASAERQTPFCPHFDQCGGCQTQHADPEVMLAHKQAAVDELLKRVAGAADLPWYAPLAGNPKGYRRKARIALDATGKTLKVGFRGQRSQQVVDIQQCEVLTPPLQALLVPLRETLTKLRGQRALGHISLFDGSDKQGAVQLVLRVTRPLANQDKQALCDLARQQHCQILLDRGDDQIDHLAGPGQEAGYWVEGCQLNLGPNDFVQVNGEVNLAMVSQTLDWLMPQTGETIWDLFAGMGNFSLPLARRGAEVVGVEVSDAMVRRARANAALNKLDNLTFIKQDLTEPESLFKSLSMADKVVLDPARAGAQAVMPLLAQSRPKAVVYVSCNPATFARDLSVLLEAGWQVHKIALMDMFPYTSHTELMALVKPG